MATVYRTLTYTTGSIAAGASTSRNDVVNGNVFDVVKVKITPSNISPGELTTFALYKHNTFLATDICYNTISFAGNLVDPIETDGITSTERNEGFVAKYEDLDAVGQLHNKITNNGSVAKTYTVTITYYTVENVGGSAVFSTASTVAVPFSSVEPDASYFPVVTGNAQETFWVTGLGTGGFTIHSSNATSTATVYWHITR
jgi:hypothetical protein